MTSAWRYVNPDFELRVKVDRSTAIIEATVRNQFVVGADQATLTAHVDYVISRAGVFALRLKVPPGSRLETLRADALQRWSEKDEAGGRELEINLKQRTIGPLTLDVSFVRFLTNLPPTLALSGIHPLGVDKLTGYVSVASEPGVGVKTATFSGLTEIAAATLPGGQPAAGSLAFKNLAATRRLLRNGL